jgi:hypothetical protein
MSRVFSILGSGFGRVRIAAHAFGAEEPMAAVVRPRARRVRASARIVDGVAPGIASDPKHDHDDREPPNHASA